MPRFFFDTRDGDHVLNDPEGIEFPSLDEARKSGVLSLALMARDVLSDDEPADFAVIIRDAEGRQILTLSLMLRVHWAPVTRH